MLITGGHELGGLDSFAVALMEGFHDLGIPAEVVPPRRLPSRWSELRNHRVLKILSTSAIFSSPVAPRSICVAHGFPNAGQIGRPKFLGHLAADTLATKCRNARLVTVSEYAAVHFRLTFGIRIDGVIRNPVKRVFVSAPGPNCRDRRYITYAGRLTPAKNVHLLLPAVVDLLEEQRDLCACVVGVGPQREMLERMVENHPRVEFLGAIDDIALRERLRETAVFISANETEQFGIAYLEALSQGCSVVMPACGGGLEIAPELLGSQIQLTPLPLERSTILSALRQALASNASPIDVAPYSPRAAATAYLRFDPFQTSLIEDLLQARQTA